MFAQRLTRARIGAGLSLRELGTQVGISHTAIKKYEDGQAMPSSEMLIKLSTALGVRVEYFFRPTTLQLEQIEFRKRASLPKKQLAKISEQIIDQIERRIELEGLFPTPPVPRFEMVSGLPDQITHEEQIEDAADLVRKAWNLGSDPIPDLIDLFEKNGIRVFALELGDEDRFDGLAAEANGSPIIVIGNRWPGDRQRFTLAHELGHLILQGRLAESLDLEKSCNHFAGSFLLPAASAYQILGANRTRLESRELALLKEEHGLSMSAILYRSYQLGIITPAYFNQLVKLFRIKGWHRQEPGRVYPPEQAHLAYQLVIRAVAEDYIGEAKAAELLNKPLGEFRRYLAMENSCKVNSCE